LWCAAARADAAFASRSRLSRARAIDGASAARGGDGRSASDADADLDLLAYALDRGYGGRGFVPPESWTAMTSALGAIRGKATTAQAFCTAIGDALWQLPDAHIGARRGDDKCGTLRVKAKRAPNVGAYRGKEPWGTDSIASGRMSIGVMSIRSFPFHEDPVWAGFEDAVRALLTKDAVIVDMRSNGGGDDTRGYALAEALVDGSVVDGALRMHERQTPETLTLWMNTVYAQRGGDGTLAPHILARLTEAKTKRDASLHAGAPEWKVKENGKRTIDLGPHAFHGPIAILVDAACASSCESSLVVLREHPKARVFGERTAGYIHFGNVGRVTLPRSHVRVNIPTKYDEFPNGKLYDKIGFEPDVAITPGSDAFAAALEWIAKERD
jgi:hypothetical protein